MQAGIRLKPPETRSSLTKQVVIDEYTLYVTVGFYENAQPCELFITIAKAGTLLAGVMSAIGIATSLALQYGVPWAAIKRKFEHQRFEPANAHYTSVIDAVAKTASMLIEQQGGIAEAGPTGAK